MLTVETIGRIRREYFLKGKTIKEIARELQRVPEHGAQGAAVWGDGSRVRARRSASAEARAWPAELDELLAATRPRRGASG